ncbi:MAG TPA: hypothetical protein VL048_11330 [Xanthobacteraceae bacterium]|jgi:hypothetical protein|nr:hypothetical protein [Xanthobacteraceae bacterium]
MRLLQAVLLIAATASPAFAQRAPEIVIPGKPGVPVYINGIDASWGVVEGDFGLDRPGMVTPTVIWRPVTTVALPVEAPSYYPKTGKRPGYGRLEIVPPRDRPLPPPAPTYYRSWSSGSSSAPVTEYAPYYGPDAIGFGNVYGHRRHAPKSAGPKGHGGKGP